MEGRSATGPKTWQTARSEGRFRHIRQNSSENVIRRPGDFSPFRVVLETSPRKSIQTRMEILGMTLKAVLNWVIR